MACTDKDVDDAIQAITQEREHDYSYLFDDRKALALATQAIVETLRQIRDRFPVVAVTPWRPQAWSDPMEPAIPDHCHDCDRLAHDCACPCSGPPGSDECGPHHCCKKHYRPRL